MRWTTAIGIVLGGTGGAVAALMGSPKAPVAVAPAPVEERGVEGSRGRGVEGESASAASVAAVVSVAPTVSSAPAPVVSVTPMVAIASASAAQPAATVIAAPQLDVPATVEALHRAMLFCDQKKAFDECTRASLALDLGTSGPADPEQAKRFRKIALTHIVEQCEAGSAHACFVLASKYRAGTELAANPTGAAALEKRALDLCRKQTAPECPTP